MNFSLITNPLSPKIKHIITVYANVSKLPPPPYLSVLNKVRGSFFCVIP